MTGQAFFVLTALADGPRHGYGIVGEVAELSQGRVRLKIGSLYGVLDRLAAEGLVEPDREEAREDGLLRRYYRLTRDRAPGRWPWHCSPRPPRRGGAASLGSYLRDPHLISVSLAELLILAAAVALVAPTPPAPRQPRPGHHRIRTRDEETTAYRPGGPGKCRSSSRRARRPSWPACSPRPSCCTAASCSHVSPRWAGRAAAEPAEVTVRPGGPGRPACHATRAGAQARSRRAARGPRPVLPRARHRRRVDQPPRRSPRSAPSRRDRPGRRGEPSRVTGSAVTLPASGVPALTAVTATAADSHRLPRHQPSPAGAWSPPRVAPASPRPRLPIVPARQESSPPAPAHARRAWLKERETPWFTPEARPASAWYLPLPRSWSSSFPDHRDAWQGLNLLG